MNLIQLKENLIAMNIPKHFYSLEGGLPNEAYCIGWNKGIWEVYYSEKGNKTDLKKFRSEIEACDFFYNSFIKLIEEVGLI